MARIWIAGAASVAAALTLLVTAANAGGWASVTLDRPLTEPRAGEMIEVGFVVKQHDIAPVHRIGDQAIEPVFIARHEESGERVESKATPTKQVGHFVVDVQFPKAGVWSAEIVPAPFAGTKLSPITVLASTGARTGASAADEGAIAPMTAAAPEASSSGGLMDTAGAIGLVALVTIAAGATLLGGRRALGRAG